MKIVVDERNCPQNHPCPSIRVCPVNAITQVGYNAPVINEELCIKCKKCVMYCPMGAIKATE